MSEHTEQCAVLGIDPGNQFGLAVVTIEPEPKFLYGFGDKMNLKRSHGACWYVDECFERKQSITNAVIEDQYLPRGPKANIDTAIKIGRNSGRWYEACARWGIVIEFIKPAAWQHRQLKGLIRGGHPTRAQRKAAAVEFCRLAWKIDLSEDVADAACMARVVATRISLERARR